MTEQQEQVQEPVQGELGLEAQSSLPSEMELAQRDEMTAVHILGGFGVNVHAGDLDYATKVNENLDRLAKINAEDVECMLCLVKVRRPDNKFDLVGATFGLEPELTALHMVLGARLRQLRAVIAAQIQAQMAAQGQEQTEQSTEAQKEEVNG